MEFVAHKFENTPDGQLRKDEYTKQLAADGFRVISEKPALMDAKTNQQGCLSFFALPLALLASKDVSGTLVTYGRETLYCSSCGTGVISAVGACPTCKAELSAETLIDRKAARLIAQRKEEAAQRTTDINKRVEELSRILEDTLVREHRFDWDSLRSEFPEQPPLHPVTSENPAQPAVLQLTALLPFLDPLIPSLHEKRLAWEKARDDNQRRNQTAQAQYEQSFAGWLGRRDAFQQEQTKQAERNRLLCMARDVKTLLEYWQLVLERSPYPENFPHSHTLDYKADGQQLTVTYTLPPLTVLPKVGEVRYNPSGSSLEEVRTSQIWLEETYTELAVNLAIKTLYELFESDSAGAISSIVFNGHAQMSDRFANKEMLIHPLVLTVTASKADFKAIDLKQVSGMSCFRRLRGVLSQNVAAGKAIEPADPQNLEKT